MPIYHLAHRLFFDDFFFIVNMGSNHFFMNKSRRPDDHHEAFEIRLIHKIHDPIAQLGEGGLGNRLFELLRFKIPT